MNLEEAFDSDKATSAEWSLADWNSALIQQIFMRPERRSASLSRVDTTGRLLRAISGEVDEATAKQQFIAAFGSDPIQIRSHFTWSSTIPVITRRKGIPPTFAALYLSLLAASADDSTFEDGKFRSRFSLLLNSPDLENFPFHDLPKLWAHFAGWTRSRQQSNRDCAQLLLPDPQHERLIGQSKRLAFPTYRDERQLRNVLKKSRLDSDSSFSLVSAAMHSQLSLFSMSFREELTAFHQLVVKGRQLEAYESPFWGAIRDISQEAEDDRVKDYGRFCVVLDASDPQYPEFCLLADRRGLGSLAERERIVLDRPQGNYLLMWRDELGSLAIDPIASLAARHRDFARSLAGTALLAGFLALFPDSVGAMTTDGDYYEGGPVAFVSRRKYWDRITSICHNLGIPWIRASTHDAGDEWNTMVFPSISRISLDRLSFELPEGAVGLLKKGWRPPRPHLNGGAWFGQAMLLNPAGNPMVRLEGCSAGRFELNDGRGEEIASGELVAANDELHIPAAILKDIRGVAVCRYVLKLDAGVERTLEVPVVTEIPAMGRRELADRGAWLFDGPAGSLVGLDSVLPPADRTSRATRLDPLIGGWPLFEPSPSKSLATCASMEWGQASQPFGWIAEALALRYAKRANLPFAELRAHLDMVAAATDISQWRLRRLLLTGCWLNSVESRTSPYPTLILADRMISCTSAEGRSVARISGMFQDAELHSLRQSLRLKESIHQIGTNELTASIGCLEVLVESEDRARELAEQNGLVWLERASLRNPLAGILVPTSEIGFREVMRPNLPLEEWDSTHSRWLESKALAQIPSLGALFKARGNQRNTYWIKAKDGFFATDCSSWAWLVRALQVERSLGVLASNGDVAWSGSIRSLPGLICRWWLHFGGGCIGTDPQGRLLFLGGVGKSVWDGVATRSSGQSPARSGLVRALERRALALKLTRRRSG